MERRLAHREAPPPNEARESGKLFSLTRRFNMPSTMEKVEVESRADLRAWFSANWERSDSVWIIRYKKSAGDRHVTYDELVDEAICFGWVDSRPRMLDARRSMNLVSPRNPKSGWSRVNKARVERLGAAGMMAPSGLACVEAAKQDGSWNKLDQVDAGVMPADLADALKKARQAFANFTSFPPSSKKIILEWIASAKTPETRARRVAETPEKAAKGERANHWRDRR